MKILAGKEVASLKEASSLAFLEAGMGSMSADIIDMFGSLAEDQKTRSEADRMGDYRGEKRRYSLLEGYNLI
jgi:hypothetical protein